MELLISKLLAVGLALSQIAVAPDELNRFDPDRDQGHVAQLLQTGCSQMRKAFDVEDINLDDLIATAMDDPEALAGNHAIRGIDLSQLLVAYRQFCKNERVPEPAVDLGEVINFYNGVVADLPDHARLAGVKLPGTSIVLDRHGERFAEVFEQNARRLWVTLADVPEHVQKAFVAAEDKRFFQHNGIDEHGLIRALIGNLASPRRPQGGSTITQQVVKNLLVGDDLSIERKIREMIVAARLERTLSKPQILELYLNTVYLGRGSWGIELAAHSYFGKSAKELTLKEGAFLAGLTKGPSYYSPDRHPARAQERLAYVLGRLQQEGVVGAEPPKSGLPPLPAFSNYERPRRDIGFHFGDQVAREARSVAGIETMTAESLTLHTTLEPRLQRAVEEALQEGLSRYERNAGRAQFQGGEINLGQAIARIEANRQIGDTRPAWQIALASAQMPLYDVHWTSAVVVQAPAGRQRSAGRVGLRDGRILPLALGHSRGQQQLRLHDVVMVQIVGSWKSARAELRVRPEVQGAVVVLENKTGAILAMTGGFSYPLSQLNRATQSMRQPGSAIKPLSYLAALGKGLQPNTLVYDETISLPPIGGAKTSERDYWAPKNYDGGSGGFLTLRAALENSRNLATVRLLDGGIESSPEASLDRVCALAVEAKVYEKCLRYYPTVLGAQPVRLVDLAAFFASIANEGSRPTPHVVTAIERHDGPIYRRADGLEPIRSVDRPAFYQLKSMLQGVIARGTARSIAELAPYVAGKTGTSDDENDAWFVGFTNQVTVAVWLGYDNADGKRRTLGSGATGGSVAVPIFASVIEAVWANKVTPKSLLAPPSFEASRGLSCKGMETEEPRRRGRRLNECFRVDAKGRVVDTQYRLVSRVKVSAQRDRRNDARAREPIVPREVAEPSWGWNREQRDWGRFYANPFWSEWR